jgi:hypothetical protein
VALLGGFAGIPWAVKPLYGFISDTFPLWGSKRRVYLVLCGMLGSTAWFGLATLPPSIGLAAVAICSASLATAFSDVVVDSVVVTRARGTPTRLGL